MLGLGNSIISGVALEDAFSLDQISGLQVWYKFDTNITLNGSNVSEWGDNSSNGNNLRQATASRQPAYNSGNIHFDETDDRMEMGTELTLTTASGFTILAVISTDSTSVANQTLFSGGGVNGKNFFRYDSTLWRFRPESGSASQATITHALTNEEKFLLTVIGSESSGTLNFAVRDNGAAIGNANCPVAAGSDTFKLDRIADHNTTNQLWDGKISEFVVYNTNLTGDDLTNAENDLTTRHSIS